MTHDFNVHSCTAPPTTFTTLTCKLHPRGFLVLEQRGRGQLLATTHELNALNARLRDAAGDAIMLTQQVCRMSHTTCV